MAEKPTTLNDNINKKDLELILEVNKKAIEIESLVAEQHEKIIEALDEIIKTQTTVAETAIEIKKDLISKNEEIINSLDTLKNIQQDHDEKIDKIITKSEETNRDIYKLQVLFITGLLSLVIQIIQIFIKK